MSADCNRRLLRISTYRTATVEIGYSRELCISIEPRKVFEASSQKTDVGSNG